MKKIMILAVLFTLYTTAAFPQQRFEKLEDDQVSKTELKLAGSLGEKLMLGQKSGKIYMLSETEAIPQVAKGFTREMQISTYETIRPVFGDYKSMEFEEAWKMEADQLYTIYRFRGRFDGTAERPEIRIVMNKEGKLAGFWVRPWEDGLEGKP